MFDRKEYQKEYRKLHKVEQTFRNINKRCKPSYWVNQPAYTGCINNWNKDEFIEYYNQHAIRSDVVYSIDKDSVNINNKIYDLDNSIIIPNQLNTMLKSVDTCNSSSLMCKNGNKYQLQMTINSKLISLGYYSTLEELYLQKSIINAYKTLELFKFFYNHNTIDDHTYQKFLDGNLYQEYNKLSNQINIKHKQKIDDVISKIKIITN